MVKDYVRRDSREAEPVDTAEPPCDVPRAAPKTIMIHIYAAKQDTLDLASRRVDDQFSNLAHLETIDQIDSDLKQKMACHFVEMSGYFLAQLRKL